MSALRIRAAGADDHATLVAFNQAMALETEGKALDPERLAAGVAKGLADPRRARYFVAERDGAVVGSLMLTAEWSDWRDGDFWWIQSVYVAPEARRQGVYRSLHRHVEQLAAAAGEVCGVRLYVDRDNTGAQATYRALGMEETAYRLYETEL